MNINSFLDKFKNIINYEVKVIFAVIAIIIGIFVGLVYFWMFGLGYQVILMFPIIPAFLLIIPYKNIKISQIAGLISIVVLIIIAIWCSNQVHTCISYYYEFSNNYYNFVANYYGYNLPNYDEFLVAADSYKVGIYYALFNLISAFFLIIPSQKHRNNIVAPTTETVEFKEDEEDDLGFCDECGKKIESSNSKFCSHCGKKLP